MFPGYVVPYRKKIFMEFTSRYFAKSKAKSVNLNPAYYYIFRNLLIIAKLNSVYSF